MLLRTNLRDWTPEALWRTISNLSEAVGRVSHPQKRACRSVPSGISAKTACWRTSGVLLAYVLWKTLEQWQSRAGLGNSPRTVSRNLAPSTAPT